MISFIDDKGTSSVMTVWNLIRQQLVQFILPQGYSEQVCVKLSFIKQGEKNENEQWLFKLTIEFQIKWLPSPASAKRDLEVCKSISIGQAMGSRLSLDFMLVA